MLSFCLRALLYCFTFIKTHAIWFLLLHIVYAILIARVISKLFDNKIMAYNLLSEKVKRKFAPFIRKGSSKIKKWQLILGAIYLLPIRLTLAIINLFLIWANMRI